MRSAIFAATILSLCLADGTEKRGSGNVIQVPLTRKNTTSDKYRSGKARNLRKRLTIEFSSIAPYGSPPATTTSSSTEAAPTTDSGGLDFTGTRYFVDYEIAGQKLTGILDTGSSDTFCFLSDPLTLYYNTFDPSKSSSYQWLNNDFKAAYGTGSNRISGTWSKDTVTLGDASVDGYQFALLNQSDILFEENRGIFGMSVDKAEESDVKYPMFVEQLKDNGVISSNSFSLSVSSDLGVPSGDDLIPPSTQGTLVLGGIDLAKCNDSLYTVPWSQEGLIGSEYYAVDTEVNGTSFQAIWDTGTAEILLPEKIADSYAHKNGFYFDILGEEYVKLGPSNMAGKEGLTFNFSGVNITVPAEDLIIEETSEYSILGLGRSIVQSNATFSIALNILGDPIIRQLNLAFDLDNKQYGLCPVKYTSDSNVQAITNSIPGAIPAPDA